MSVALIRGRLTSLQTERSMVQVCEGQKTKNDMLVESIDQYKEVYILAKREFQKVMQVGYWSSI
jgi:DNA topoisomerase-3